ncbi:uncharacterized protein LOC132701914 isoform X2 [Cylas formicarius]|uniref:uncharacterized protein LOC132701914 isoform X2 n=1 Tax=Cylas formicarius TaxID=197179 RepID=UPI0029584CB2|nr:uncharacterized protein LOC132701914 isoform X2 [Cylas formicarius]
MSEPQTTYVLVKPGVYKKVNHDTKKDNIIDKKLQEVYKKIEARKKQSRKLFEYSEPRELRKSILAEKFSENKMISSTPYFTRSKNVLTTPNSSISPIWYKDVMEPQRNVIKKRVLDRVCSKKSTRETTKDTNKKENSKQLQLRNTIPGSDDQADSGSYTDESDDSALIELVYSHRPNIFESLAEGDEVTCLNFSTSSDIGVSPFYKPWRLDNDNLYPKQDSSFRLNFIPSELDILNDTNQVQKRAESNNVKFSFPFENTVEGYVTKNRDGSDILSFDEEMDEFRTLKQKANKLAISQWEEKTKSTRKTLLDSLLSGSPKERKTEYDTPVNLARKYAISGKRDTTSVDPGNVQVVIDKNISCKPSTINCRKTKATPRNTSKNLSPKQNGCIDSPLKEDVHIYQDTHTSCVSKSSKFTKIQSRAKKTVNRYSNRNKQRNAASSMQCVPQRRSNSETKTIQTNTSKKLSANQSSSIGSLPNEEVHIDQDNPLHGSLASPVSKNSKFTKIQSRAKKTVNRYSNRNKQRNAASSMQCVPQRRSNSETKTIQTNTSKKLSANQSSSIGSLPNEEVHIDQDNPLHGSLASPVSKNSKFTTTKSNPKNKTGRKHSGTKTTQTNTSEKLLSSQSCCIGSTPKEDVHIDQDPPSHNSLAPSVSENSKSTTIKSSAKNKIKIMQNTTIVKPRAPQERSKGSDIAKVSLNRKDKEQLALRKKAVGKPVTTNETEGGRPQRIRRPVRYKTDLVLSPLIICQKSKTSRKSYKKVLKVANKSTDLIFKRSFLILEREKCLLKDNIRQTSSDTMIDHCSSVNNSQFGGNRKSGDGIELEKIIPVAISEDEGARNELKNTQTSSKKGNKIQKKRKSKGAAVIATERLLKVVEKSVNCTTSKSHLFEDLVRSNCSNYIVSQAKCILREPENFRKEGDLEVSEVSVNSKNAMVGYLKIPPGNRKPMSTCVGCIINFTVVKGEALLVYNGEEALIREGQSFIVAVGWMLRSSGFLVSETA